MWGFPGLRTKRHCSHPNVELTGLSQWIDPRTRILMGQEVGWCPRCRDEYLPIGDARPLREFLGQ